MASRIAVFFAMKPNVSPGAALVKSFFRLTGEHLRGTLGFMLALEWILCLAASWLFIHQIVWPSLSNKPLLSFFRKKSLMDQQLEAARRREVEALKRLRLEQVLAYAEEVETKIEHLEQKRVDRIMMEEV